MTPNPPEILRDRGRSLEDEFFRREDRRLMERLSELRAAEATREALGKASGITKPAVLEKLMELGIRAETVAALSIVPLVEVAWADGALDAKERRAVVERAGVARDSTAGALLEAWLDRQIKFDAVWEGKVVERILHNMSLLMGRSFQTVQELNSYRKELAALPAPADSPNPV